MESTATLATLLTSVGSVFTAFTGYIGDVADIIVNNPLLLLGACIPFVFAVISLVKRFI